MKSYIHTLLAFSVITALSYPAYTNARSLELIQDEMSSRLTDIVTIIENNKANGKAKDAAANTLQDIKAFKNSIDKLTSANLTATKMTDIEKAYKNLVNPNRKPNYKTIQYNIDLIKGAMLMKAQVRNAIVAAYESLYTLESLLQELRNSLTSQGAPKNKPAYDNSSTSNTATFVPTDELAKYSLEKFSTYSKNHSGKAILGLPNNATIAEVKKAYRALSLKFHPDKHNNSDLSKEVMQTLNNTYDVYKS